MTTENTITYRLKISYFGEGFHGWQSQSDGSGIQDIVEKSLLTIIREPIRLTASSRTDTGVHAEDQVATFRTTQKLDLHKIVKGLNALLPREVRVFGCDVVDSSFHPMHSSTGKVYRYTFWNHSGEMVPYSKHAWQVPISLSPDQVQVLKRVFEGEHDFSAFCSSDSSAINKVRIIFGLRFYQSGPLTEMWIHGSGFLKQMVRIIAGSVKSFSDGKIDERGLVSLMKSKDRTLAPQTAPAMGLTLMKVCFDEDFSFHDWFDQYEGRGSLVLEHSLEKHRS